MEARMPISDAPVAATAHLDTLADKLAAFSVTARMKATDGLTLVELGELLFAFLRLAIEQVDDLTTLTGEQKRAAVMAGVAVLFDTLAPLAIPAVFWPFWLVQRGIIRMAFLAITAGALEVILPLTRTAP
jgi:hypothetical protein